MKTRYIHYGHKHFSEKLFQKIKNNSMFPKPNGGFWGSPVVTAYGWKQWCKGHKFRECSEDNSFRFELTDDANVLHIRSMDDLKDIPLVREDRSWYCLDFEKLLKSGVDAVELHLSEDQDLLLYWRIYGWFCDSILIMNKDVVREIKK